MNANETTAEEMRIQDGNASKDCEAQENDGWDGAIDQVGSDENAEGADEEAEH